MSSVRKLLWDCLLWVIFVGQSLNIQDGGDIGCYPPTIMVQRCSKVVPMSLFRENKTPGVLEEPIFLHWSMIGLYMWISCYFGSRKLYGDVHWKITTSNVSSRCLNNTFGRKRKPRQTHRLRRRSYWKSPSAVKGFIFCAKNNKFSTGFYNWNWFSWCVFVRKPSNDQMENPRNWLLSLSKSKEFRFDMAKSMIEFLGREARRYWTWIL